MSLSRRGMAAQWRINPTVYLSFNFRGHGFIVSTTWRPLIKAKAFERLG